ncbi:MAG TPA: hypothetical protein VK478_03540 [Gemmatimonadaceae bacterium]|nr:hypothetical protein [Gemmatimonadaceae bacterium]
MDERPFSISARKLELRQTQQGIFSLGCERIIDHYVLVIALRIRCV